MFHLLILFLTGIRAMDIPNCDFFDTVNISSSKQFLDGSYIYDGVLIPANMTGTYDYQIDPKGNRKTVPEHIRGCVCGLKACVRLCCPHTQIRDSNGCSDSRNTQNMSTWDYSLNVTLDDGSVKTVDILKDMIKQHDTPFSCVSYPLDARDPNTAAYSWALYENGSLWRHFDSKWLSKQEYCLQLDLDKEEGPIYLVANNCAVYAPPTMAYVKLASAFFLVITIAVYLWLPQFHYIHGRCSVMYFACLACAFVLNATSNFHLFEDTPMCPINGYVGYFMVMSTFLWLSVISFNVWLGFLEKIPHSSPPEEARRFWYYHIYVWTTATLLTLIVFLVSTFVPRNESNIEYVPEMCAYGCWISTVDYSALPYFYFPMGVLVSVNGIFFYLTTRQLYGDHKDIRTRINQENAHQSTGVSYHAYMRLFIVMGCNWILEFVGYICQMEGVDGYVGSVNEMVNCCEGLIIFLVTICNRRTIRETFKSFQNRDRDGSSTEFSSRQDSSRVKK